MKKLTALLLTLLLAAGLLAGCGGGGEEQTSSTPSTSPSTEPVVLTSVEPSGEAPSTEFELPIVDHEFTIDYWRQNGDTTLEGFTDYNDTIYAQWLEEQTGIHVNWMNPPVGSERESFQTMILSNDLPDVIQGFFSLYNGGMDKAIQDGIILRLNEKVDEVMPNYRSVVYSSNELFVQCVSDSGNLWGIHHITDRPQGCYRGLGIRYDWLEKAGMSLEDVETIDGVEAAMTAFKDYTYNNVGPIFLDGSALQSDGGLNASYNVGAISKSQDFLNVDGTICYSALMPGFKDYAAKIGDWYAKGLINTSYIAENAWLTPEDKWANGEAGLGSFIYTQDKMYAASAAVSELNPDANFKLEAITSPKVNASDDWSDIHVRMNNDRVRPGTSGVITTNCSDVDIVCKWFDYQWTEEGKHAAQWGPYEGEYGDKDATYYVDESDANGDGFKEGFQPWTIEKWRNASSVQQMVSAYNWPTWAVWSREYSLMEPYQIAFADTWDRVSADWVLPSNITLTKDEGEQASAIVTDANTLSLTWLAEVITGEKSADTYETELVAKLEGIGIHDAEQLYQNALDRYFARINYAE